MKEIKLTQNKVALVDDEDYEYLNQWRWCVNQSHQSSNTKYAVRWSYANKKPELLRMHRIITNAPDNMQVDHINHNGLDNQKYNLRVCTHAENSRNRLKNKRCSSKYKGVKLRVFHIKNKLKDGSVKHYSYGPVYTVNIGQHGVLKFIGNFKSEQDAALAYNEAAKKYYGEFANLNIIQ